MYLSSVNTTYNLIMKSKFKNLQLDSLDKKFAKISFAPKPRQGWIKMIRTALVMPASFLAKQIGISQQSIAQFEKNEAEETITIKSLRNVAAAMDCELHYILLPRNKSLRKIIAKQAYRKAELLVKEVDKTMVLEDQKVVDLANSVKLLAKELAQNPNSKLWEDNA